MRAKKLSSSQGRAKACRGYVLSHNLTKISQQHVGWESPAVQKLCAVCIWVGRDRKTYHNKDYTWECTEMRLGSTKHTWRRLSPSITQLNMGRHISFCSLDDSYCVWGGYTFVFISLFLGCENRLAASTRLSLRNVCVQQLQLSCRKMHLPSSGFQLFIPAFLLAGTASSSPLLHHVKAQ